MHHLFPLFIASFGNERMPICMRSSANEFILGPSSLDELQANAPIERTRYWIPVNAAGSLVSSLLFRVAMQPVDVASRHELASKISSAKIDHG